MPFRSQPNRCHIHPARRVLLVLDLDGNHAHHPKAHVDPAGVDDFVGDGEQVRDAGGGIAVLLLVAGAVEHHDIDGGSAWRRLGIIRIGAAQPLVGVGHAVAVGVLEIVEIVHPEPTGGIHWGFHQRPVLLHPVVALELLKHEFKRSFAGDVYVKPSRRRFSRQTPIRRHGVRDLNDTEPIVVPALLGMPPPPNDDPERRAIGIPKTPHAGGNRKPFPGPHHPTRALEIQLLAIAPRQLRSRAGERKQHEGTALDSTAHGVELTFMRPTADITGLPKDVPTKPLVLHNHRRPPTPSVQRKGPRANRHFVGRRE